ncbi:MAG: Uma2 family endonuclease [Saprospiraceae bacterium]|nr:Uma2 family endonuclease [Saprospiraceae bacterium]
MAKTDRTTKFQDYAAHGVPEYWIIDPNNQPVGQYWLQSIPAKQYALVAKWSVLDQITAQAVAGFLSPLRLFLTATLVPLP